MYSWLEQINIFATSEQMYYERSSKVVYSIQQRKASCSLQRTCLLLEFGSEGCSNETCCVGKYLPGDRQIHNDLKQIYVLGVLGRITSFAAK
jgi:hypothetical protein